MDDGSDGLAVEREPPPDLHTVFSAVLEAVDDSEALEDFMELHAGLFAGYVRGGEQRLEYTVLHAEYTAAMEAVISDQLASLQCSAETLVEHVQSSLQRSLLSSQADKLMSRLLAMQDYEVFCGMMHAEATGVIDPWLVQRMMSDGVGPVV